MFPEIYSIKKIPLCLNDCTCEMCHGQYEASVINWIKLAQSTFCNSDVQKCPWKMSSTIHLNIWPDAHYMYLQWNHSLR